MSTLFWRGGRRMRSFRSAGILPALLVCAIDQQIDGETPALHNLLRRKCPQS
jgi:hypothetical protein